MKNSKPKVNYLDLERMWPITKVVIEVIPHLAQRYETCGDWFRTIDTSGKATLHVYASNLGDADPYNYMSMCIAYHELGEALACLANNINEKVVDDWDFNYKGDDPGNDAKCPYTQQHRWATGIEKSLLVAMGIFWATYERAINRLFK